MTIEEKANKSLDFFAPVFMQQNLNCDFMAVLNENKEAVFLIAVYDKKKELDKIDEYLISIGLENEDKIYYLDLNENYNNTSYLYDYISSKDNDKVQIRIIFEEFYNDLPKNKKTLKANPFQLYDIRKGGHDIGKISDCDNRGTLGAVLTDVNDEAYIITCYHCVETKINGKVNSPTNMTSDDNCSKKNIIGSLYWYKYESVNSEYDIALIKVNDKKRVDSGVIKFDLADNIGDKPILGDDIMFFGTGSVQIQKGKVINCNSYKRRNKNCNHVLNKCYMSLINSKEGDSGSLVAKVPKTNELPIPVGLLHSKSGPFSFFQDLEILKTSINDVIDGNNVIFNFKQFNLNKLNIMAKKKFPTARLRYDFKLNKYQPVFYGHIFGTTFTIAAKLNMIKKDGNTYIRGYFVSKNMGGLIKFSLSSIGSDVNTDGQKYQLNVKMNAFTNHDTNIGESVINLGKDFDPAKNHFININIADEDIINLIPKKHIFVCDKNEINDDRSCDITPVTGP